MGLILFYFVLNQCALASGLDSGALNFLVIGDWGGLPYSPYTTGVQVANAKMMGLVANQTNSSFVVALGDNFYFTGVQDEHDGRFFDTFEHVYSASSLHIPWYVVAGNHDHYGNASAQIAYSKLNPIWNFDYYYYSKQWKIPGTNKTMKLIMIDTVQLCGNSGVDGTQPQGPEDPESSEEQWRWLEKELATSSDDYLLVGGHFPVWSIAEHGPTKCLVKRLIPMLEEYHVTAYINGHDHNLQHILPDNSTVNYFVIGCSNFVDFRVTHKHSIPEGSCKFHWANIFKLGGFAHVYVDEHFMSLSFVDSDGGILYTQKMKPRL